MRRTSKNEKSKAIKRADVRASKKVRERDKLCRKCKKTASRQCAHIFSRSNLATRWEMDNLLGMCYYCHIIWAHRCPVEFTEWVRNEIGLKKYNRLKKLAATIYQPTIEEINKVCK
jgi:hypothetical protein